MFITEEQLKERLLNPRNLANRFRGGREITMEQAIIEGELDASRRISEISISENGTQEKVEDPENLHQESIQFREIKRPGNNRPWLSQQERTRIAADVTSTAIDKYKTRTEIAKAHGVAVSTVSDIANNVRRVPNSDRSVDQAAIDLALDKVREKAIEKLMSGLNQITEDKISAHNAKDISTVCSNMARVVQQTIPQDKTAQAINLIVYTPEMRKEQNFNVVEVE